MVQVATIGVPASSHPARRGLRISDLRLRVKMLVLTALAGAVALTIGAVGQASLGSAQSSGPTMVSASAKPALVLSAGAKDWARYRRFGLQVLLASDPAKIKVGQDGLATTARDAQDAVAAFVASNADDDLKSEARKLQADMATALNIWATQIDLTA